MPTTCDITITMIAPLTFGVEFEMAVVSGIESGEHYHTDKRIISFDEDPSSDNDYEGTPETSNNQRPQDPHHISWHDPDIIWTPIANHMAATLRSAGFPTCVDKDNYSKWDFTCDYSIHEPRKTQRAGWSMNTQASSCGRRRCISDRNLFKRWLMS